MAATNITSVPLLDLKRQYAPIRERIRNAIDEVCDSQYFVMGPKVAELESQVASYSQCSGAIGVSSGTDALLVALMALDVGPGTAVVTTPYTFFATGGTIARLGARPVYCDIERDTYNLDPGAVRRFLEDDCESGPHRLRVRDGGERVAAIMPVHLYGQTADMEAFNALSEEFGLPIVEDAAQSIGSEYLDGKRAGSEGEIGCFSFFPSKNLGAFGDGGMCTTNDDELGEKIRVLRVHGGKPKYYHAMVGGNFRLDALQAAVLIEKLAFLDDWTARRQQNAKYYDEKFAASGLEDKVSTPVTRTGSRHIYNQYILRVQDRDALRAHLGDAGIGTEIYYPVPLHMQECFSYLGYQAEDCPESASAADETIAVPIFPELTDDEQDYVVDKICEFYS